MKRAYGYIFITIKNNHKSELSQKHTKHWQKRRKLERDAILLQQHRKAALQNKYIIIIVVGL